MLNDKQTSIKFTVPYGMALHGTGIPQEYSLVFAYEDVEKVEAWAASIALEAKRVKENAEKFLKPVEQLGCQHPKERLKFTNEGVFCLQCNESILAPVKGIPQELPPQPRAGTFESYSFKSLPTIPGGPALVPMKVGDQTIHVPAKVGPKPPEPPKPEEEGSQPRPEASTEPKKDV